jgi:ankyrin repeat protein
MTTEGLIESLTPDLQDMILMYLSSDNIRMIGEDNVSDYVWNQKKDRTIMEAILNNNLLGLKHVIASQGIRKVYTASLQLSAMLGNLDIIKFLVNRCNMNVNNSDNIVLLLSANHGHLHIVKYLVEIHDTGDVNPNVYNRAIQWAARNGHLNIIEYFIEESGLAGIDIHANFEEALQQSAKHGHLEVVQFLVEHGADIYIENSIIFRFSAMNGHLEVIKFLIEYDKNAYKYCEEALFWAANNGHIEVVQYLIEHGVAFHDKLTLNCSGLNDNLKKEIIKYLTDNTTISNNTKLRWDIAGANLKKIKTIVKTGADKNIVLCICAERGDLEAIKWLIENGATACAYLNAALRVSARMGHLRVVEYLIKRGADIYEYDGEALELAVQNGHLSVVKCLINNGARIYEPGDYGIFENLVLRIAATNGHLDILQYMMYYTRDKGGNVERVISRSMQHAIKNGQMEIIRYLIKKEADDYSIVLAASNGDLAIMRFLTNSVCTSGFTDQGIDIHANFEEPLRMAARNGHLSMVKYLVSMGADINKHYIGENSFDYLDFSALEWAAEKGYFEIAKYLVENGANIHKGGDNALLLSSENGHLQIVKCLIEAGSDIYADDEYNALDRAADNGHYEIVKYLVENGANKDYGEVLKIAAESGHMDVVIYIMEHCNVPNTYINEALRTSAKYGKFEIVKYLVEIGANIHVNRNESNEDHHNYIDDGYTALELSTKNGHLLVAEYLRKQMNN